MGKDILTILGLDGIMGFIVWATDPSFLKVVLGVGFVTLIALLCLSKQGRVSIYGANLMMGFLIAIRYL